MIRLIAIILAAGSGQRMAAGMNKVLLPLDGQPVLKHSLSMWQPLARHIFVAAQLSDWPSIIPVLEPYGKQVTLVPGGANRPASLQQALAVLPPSPDATRELIAVHDAARPLTSTTDIQRVIAAAHAHGAAILAAPVTDTIRYRANANWDNLNRGDGFCGEIVPRQQLLAAQTPQIFRRDWLEAAYAAADENQLNAASDDAALVQAYGLNCAYVWAEFPNLKLTWPEDLIMAEAIITNHKAQSTKHK